MSAFSATIALPAKATHQKNLITLFNLRNLRTNNKFNSQMVSILKTFPTMKIRREAAGFSLVELTIAIGLIALLLSAGFLAMSEALARWRLNTATTDLSYTVLAARTKASMTRSQVAITFDSIDGKYMLSSLAGNDASLDRLNDRTQELPTGVRFVSRPPDSLETRSPRSFFLDRDA